MRSTVRGPNWCPPSVSRDPPRKRGARPKYPWDEMEAKTYQLMSYHGPFSADDPVWDAQARLEEKLLKFCYDKTGREPSIGSLRTHLKPWLENSRSERPK